MSPLTVSQVAFLLDELASASIWSDASIRSIFSLEILNEGRRTGPDLVNPRPPRTVFTRLFAGASPSAAAYLTQIILHDITPLLCPPPSSVVLFALKDFDSSSRHILTEAEVGQLWDRNFWKARRIRAGLDETLEALDRMQDGVKLGVEVGKLVSVGPVAYFDDSPGRQADSPPSFQIPKCMKARDLESTVKGFLARGQSTVWAETKYDGER